MIWFLSFSPNFKREGFEVVKRGSETESASESGSFSK